MPFPRGHFRRSFAEFTAGDRTVLPYDGRFNPRFAVAFDFGMPDAPVAKFTIVSKEGLRVVISPENGNPV
jgi:hypothetical protein